MVDAQVSAILALKSVAAGYDETVVLEEIDFQVAAGESVSIIGRNGVGKSTLLATMMGHTRMHAGEIRLFGRDAAQQSIHGRALAGIGYVPQEREIFASLTVVDLLSIPMFPMALSTWRVALIWKAFKG